MRILIDECIDERFRNSLPGHVRQTARYAGLAGLTNGELLAAAETAKFEVFLTVDQGIEYQQNLTGRSIAIIIVRTKSNRLKDLLPHVPVCLAQIESIQPGQIVRIEGQVKRNALLMEDSSEHKSFQFSDNRTHSCCTIISARVNDFATGAHKI